MTGNGGQKQRLTSRRCAGQLRAADRRAHGDKRCPRDESLDTILHAAGLRGPMAPARSNFAPVRRSPRGQRVHLRRRLPGPARQGRSTTNLRGGRSRAARKSCTTYPRKGRCASTILAMLVGGSNQRASRAIRSVALRAPTRCIADGPYRRGRGGSAAYQPPQNASGLTAAGSRRRLSWWPRTQPRTSAGCCIGPAQSDTF